MASSSSKVSAPTRKFGDSTNERYSPITGLPEHRHEGYSGWHWAWSTHGGKIPQGEGAHAGLVPMEDPRTPEQVKAGVGHSASHQKGYVKKADRELAKAKVETVAQALDLLLDSAELDMIKQEA